MAETNPQSTVKIAGHPIHPMLVPFPIVCFVGALVTDIAYAETARMQWANFSVWLITVGLVMTIFVALAGAIDFLADRRIRQLRAAWIHAVGNVAVVILEIFNAFVHSRDAWTSVVPTGLTLSAIASAILLITGWNGWEMVYRHRVGIRAEDAR